MRAVNSLMTPIMKNARLSVLSAVFAAFVSAGAQTANAGTLVYQNGITKWEATGCAAPTAPSYMQPNANASGNALSANVEAFNQYSQAVQAYLACLSREANQDLTQAGQQVSMQITQIQQAWQQELNKRNAELQEQRGR